MSPVSLRWPAALRTRINAASPAYRRAPRLSQWSRALGAALFTLLAFLTPLAPASAAGGVFRLVVLGDSLSAGYQLPADAAFPVVLEKALRAKGYAVEVTNAAVSGDTATGGLERLDWALGPQTDAVILELGANDMLRGLDPAVTRRALDAILTKLGKRGVRVLIAGMTAAPNLGADYGARFSALYTDLAAAHRAPLYPFFLDGVAADPKLNLADGMHPNRAGVEAIVARILPSVEALLKQGG